MGKWISVNERLPEVKKRVLIFYRGRQILIGYKIDLNSDPEENWYSVEDQKSKWCKYWMPLPELPEH